MLYVIIHTIFIENIPKGVECGLSKSRHKEHEKKNTRLDRVTKRHRENEIDMIAIFFFHKK